MKEVKTKDLKTWIQTEKNSASVPVFLLGLERCCWLCSDEHGTKYEIFLILIMKTLHNF